MHILEAARDILSEKGLDGLSMRAIAERIEYSPATIYLYFDDKEHLIRNVVEEAFHRLAGYMGRAIEEAGPQASEAEQHRATGRAYVRFALENTAYFKVMFQLPAVPHLDCPEPERGGVPHDNTFDRVVELLARAVEKGEYDMPDPREGAVVAWAMVHGLTSLYLAGRLMGVVNDAGEFYDLVENAMDALVRGWIPRKGEIAAAPRVD